MRGKSRQVKAMPDFSIPQSALAATDAMMAVSADNIANISTDGYKAARAVLQSGPNDEGVRLGAVYRDMSPGPAVISHLSENDVRGALDASARMRISAENYDSPLAQDPDRLQQGNSSDLLQAEQYREGQNARARMAGVVEGGNTDLPREFAAHVVMESAYSANAATIRAMDELTGAILNVKV